MRPRGQADVDFSREIWARREVRWTLEEERDLEGGIRVRGSRDTVWGGMSPKAQVEGLVLLGCSKRNNFLMVTEASTERGNVPLLELFGQKGLAASRGCYNAASCAGRQVGLSKGQQMPRKYARIVRSLLRAPDRHRISVVAQPTRDRLHSPALLLSLDRDRDPPFPSVKWARVFLPQGKPTRSPT